VVEATSDFGSRILVPLDGSALAERALPYARAIAAPGAELLLVHVASHLEPLGHGEGRATGEGGRRGDEAARQRLEAIGERLRREWPDVRIGAAFGTGNPKKEIVRIGGERGVDLIIMASRGRNEPTRRVLGSIADQVAAEAAVAVMIVPAGDGTPDADGKPVRRLVVPQDGTEQAMQAAAVAEVLAKRWDVPIQLVAAVDPAYGQPPEVLAGGDDVRRDVLAELGAEAQGMLERVGARMMRTRADVAWQLLEGPAADAILGCVRNGDLIVLTSRGRSGVSRWPLGSVAEKVVRYAPVPVLVHRAPRAGAE
jgi:nucleotide-binding universal stress UspA family protein